MIYRQEELVRELSWDCSRTFFKLFANNFMYVLAVYLNQ